MLIRKMPKHTPLALSTNCMNTTVEKVASRSREYLKKKKDDYR